MKNSFVLVGVVVAVCSLSACASSDSGSQDNTGAGGDGAGGTSGTGGAGNAGTSGAGGFALPDLSMLLTPMCDSTAMSVTSCGSNTCPALGSDAASTCTINCCTVDQRCGTRSADTRIEQISTACTPPAVTDSRCPSVSVLGTTLPGCCTGQGTCGSIIGPICLPSLTPTSCDAVPRTDAGMGASP